MFGSKPAFGASSFSAPQSVFGTPQQSTSLFGASKPTVSFGGQPQAQVSTGMFGQATPSTTVASNLFGGAGGATSSMFGGVQMAAAPATNLFGGSTATTTAASTFQPGGSSLFSFSGQPSTGLGTNLFGATAAPSGSTGLFGATAAAGFPSAQTSGTALKFNAATGHEQITKNGIQQILNVKHHCITAMKEYENKSLEELRCEDYLCNRKGPQTQTLGFNAQPATNLFGSAAVGSNLFGASSSTSTSVPGGLFGAPTGSFFSQSAAKPLFGVATTSTTSAAFPFGAQTATAGGGLFGTQPLAATSAAGVGGLFGGQPSTLFGAPTTSTAVGGLFGSAAAPSALNAFSTNKPATNLFGQSSFPVVSSSAAVPSTGFAFGGATSTAPLTFGQPTAGGFFGAAAPKSVAPTLPTFGAATFGAAVQQPAGGLFGTAAPATSGAFSFGAPQTTTNLFGQQNVQAVRPFGATSTGLFGQTQPTSVANQFSFNQSAAALGTNFLGAQQAKPGGFSFASSVPAFGSSTLALGQPQATSFSTDQSTLAAQQIYMQSYLKGLSQSPYGDTKLLHLLSGKQTTSPKSATNSPDQSSLAAYLPRPPTLLNVKPLPPDRPSPRVLTMTINLNASQSKEKKLLLNDFENDKLTFTEGYVPKRNIKKLILGRTEEKIKKAVAACSAAEESAEKNRISLFSDQRAITPFSKNSLRHSNGPLPLNLDSSTFSPEFDQSSAVVSVTPFSRRSAGGLYPELPTCDTENAEIIVNGNSAIDCKSSSNFSSAPTASADLHLSSIETRNSASSTLLAKSEPKKQPQFNAELDVASSPQDPPSPQTEPPRHPAGVLLSRPDYYLLPDLDELAAAVGASPGGGRCFVNDGLTVGRRDYGSVYWPGRIEVTGLNLDALIHFRHKEVTVYPDESVKPPVGHGLNRKAEVTLERVWPNDKTTHLPIKDTKRLGVMKFRERLERAAGQMGAEFVDYRPETGSWVFKVDHFSKYGLADAEDDEDDDFVTITENMAVDQVQRKHIEHQPIKKQILSALGGHACDALAEEDEALEDDEFPNEEPSFLVKSDYMTSFLGGQDEDFMKLKNHLFRDVNLSDQSKTGAPRASEFSSQANTPISGIKKLKPNFMTDLYERSMLLLDKKSYERRSKFEPELDVDFFGTTDIKPSLLEASIFNASSAGLQLIQPKNPLKLVPLSKSFLSEVTQCYSDSSVFNGRRFRIGWTVDRKFLTKSHHKTEGGKSADFSRLFEKDFCHSSSVSTDFHIQLNQAELDDEVKSNPLETLLITQQLCSVRYNRPQCPHFIPTDGPESIERYCKAFQSVASENQISRGDEVNFLRVFNLCSALWGKIADTNHQSQYAEDLQRKENLGAWLQQTSKQTVDEEISQRTKSTQACAIETIFSLLTVGHLSEASELAFKNGDVRLALSISQLGGPEPTKALFRQQLSQWLQSQADKFIDLTRLKIFTLLAGCVDWKTSAGVLVNPCESLDWMRAFGLHLWYFTPATFTIADCTKSYDSTWTEFGSGLSIQPLPPHAKNAKSEMDDVIIREINRPKKKDLCYHLIKLFSELSYPLQTALNNETWTSDPLSYYLSWHLWCVLSACGYNNLPDQRRNQLHLQYASQLERCGLWQWAIFVLLHIGEDFEREKSVKRLLAEYAFEANDEQTNFLRNDLAIPKSWIFEAKALKARQVGDKIKEAWFCLKSENWNAAHNIFLEYVGPIKVVDDDMEGLRLFLSEFSQQSDCLENWETGGRIFLDFVLLKTKYEEIKRSQTLAADTFDTIRSSVTSLAMRINFLICTTPLQRLCQSEMAFLVAQLFRVVLNDDEYLEFSPIIGNLPMPDDYVLEELKRLVDLSIKKIDENRSLSSS